jgi:GH43 family beta-xylosidase
MTHTYVNPLGYADGVARTDPDPFVMRFRGRYWCYSTDEHGVNVSTSPDMVTWQRVGYALTVPGRAHFWAPCVIYADGLFWMYVSHRPEGCDDPHQEFLHVAGSPAPEGPFEIRRRLFDTFSIDPHVVRDPASGEYVIFYSTNDITGLDADGTGTSILVDRLAAMDEPAGSPRPVVVPTLEQEIFERNRFGDGRDWYTIEGATYVTHRDRAYLTYSGNAYVGEDYFIGYARAPLAGGAAELGWTKYPSDSEWSPLVRRDGAVEGTGHNSIVRAPNLVDDWIVYHGRDAAVPLDPGREERVMRIDPLFYDGDRLATPAPTSTPRPAPAGATVQDDFTGPGLAPGWTVLAGDVTVEPGGRHEPGTLRTGRDLLTLLAHERQVTSHVCEVWMRAERSDTGARFGIVPVFHDPDNYVAVLIDVATASVEMRRRHGGIARSVARAPLGRFGPSAWHEVRVVRTFDEIAVRIDGVDVLSASTGDDTPAGAGLMSVGTHAEFSAFAFTEHLDLWGPRLAHLPRLFRADRPAELRAEGLAARARRPLLVEAGASAPGVVLEHEIEVLAPYGYVELRPVAVDETTYVRVRIDARTYQVSVSQDGVTRRVTEQPPPNPHPRMTVRTIVRPDVVVVGVGGDEHVLPLAVGSRFGQRIELSGSVLRGFRMTSITEVDTR